MKRVLAVSAGLLASAVLAAPASALSPPELFVRLQPWDTHEAASDWIPLASAPALNYLAGYQIGYRLQASGEPNEFQRVALTVTGVPDGQPTQPYAADPYCVGKAGTPGTIVEAGPELQFEGDGAYTVKVSLGSGSGGETGCLSGPSTTASFSVDVHVAPSLVGSPMTFRTSPPSGNAFAGVQAPAPAGGFPDVRCALDATVQPDGSLTGSAKVPAPDDSLSRVPEDVFPRPGAWSCVARGVAEGRDANFERAEFGTPWSAPLAVDVRTDFRRRSGRISRPRARRPRLTFKAEWARLATGGDATITLSRIAGCRHRRYRLRKVAAYRGRFGPKDLRLSIRRPRGGYYIGRFGFAGTRFVRASVDPTPVLLVVQFGGLGFADPRELPICART